MPDVRHPHRNFFKRTALAVALGSGALLAGGVVVAQQSQQARGARASSPPAAEQEAVESARDLGVAFSAVAEQVSPSVVSVGVEARMPRRTGGFPFGFGAPQNDGIARGNGSGVIIRPDGYILTNNHVVQHAVRIEVALQDGRVFDGRVVGTDPATDLAVLRIDADGLRAAHFADAGEVRPGQWAIAIGSPFGLDYTVTTGVVSSVGRGGLGMNEIEDYVQTDASINPGNSGGPLVNLDGRVIGINTMIVGRGSGIGFAVSSELAQRVARQIIEDGQVTRPWIGVQFQELTPELASAFSVDDGSHAGALIADVVQGGPADRAGLRHGDVIVKVDGEPVREARDLLRAILRRDVGARVQLEVVRAGQRRTVVLQTGERPGAERADAATDDPRATSNDGGPTQGLELRALSPRQQRQLGSPGVVVARLQRDSDAARAGLRPGDVIVEADGRPVSHPHQVAAALEDDRALLRVRRGDGAFYAVLAD
jgi:Do/DeqQ family serine protease